MSKRRLQLRLRTFDKNQKILHHDLDPVRTKSGKRGGGRKENIIQEKEWEILSVWPTNGIVAKKERKKERERERERE